MEHIGRRPPFRILLVGLPLWFGEVVRELLEVQANVLSLSLSEVVDQWTELTLGGVDLIIATLGPNGLPAELQRLRVDHSTIPVLGVQDDQTSLFEGAEPPISLDDRSLRDVVEKVRGVVSAFQTRRGN